MNITEIEHLLKFTSEPIRKRWEARHNNGNSLIELKKAHDQTVAQIESYRKQYKLWSTLILLLPVLIVIFGIWYFNIIIGQNRSQKFDYTVLMIPLLAMTPFIYMVERTLRPMQKAKDVLQKQEIIFEHFTRSIDELYKIQEKHIHSETIDEELVLLGLIALAWKVIDAEIAFDHNRLNEKVIRHDIIRAGSWYEKCDENFRRSWIVVTHEFGLDFDKSNVFKQAKDRWEKVNSPITDR